MRIAVLADIHGNLAALEAVLKEVETQQVDQIVFGGDLVMNGPRPAETLALVRSIDAPGVVGNTDVMVVENDTKIGRWTHRKIGGEGVAYLNRLPLHHRIGAPGQSNSKHDLLIVHASPRSCFDLLILEPQPLPESTLPGPTPVDEALDMLAGVSAGLILFGHIHFASKGTIGQHRLCSIGAVGFPFVGDPRAAYAIVSWDGAWQVEHHHVRYDYESVARDIEQRKQPNAAVYARRIREARWFKI